MEKSEKLPHRLTMEERSRLTLTGATEVLRFEEDQVEAETAAGTVTVIGAQLRLRCLSLEEGTLVIEGRIGGVFYDEPVRRRGWLR